MKKIIEREYLGIDKAFGPLVIVKNTHPVGFGELVEVVSDKGTRLGQVLDTSEEAVVIELFEGSGGLDLASTKVRFKGEPCRIAVNEEMLGRIFDGLGRPIDGGGELISRQKEDVNGLPINPVSRAYPERFIQTGISAIDGMNTLICGQKLPIFSGSGLPHNQVAAQIAAQAKIVNIEGKPESGFAIVFAAMGVKNDVAQFFIQSFKQSGALEKTVVFLSLADDPPILRLVTPRAALTAAEYLAFQKQMHILVILIDMTNYCEALREISTLRGEVPSRKGYPGYLYSDLASLYERAGMLNSNSGSITQLPILTMPNDDISHPVPDLTGYITEGQIVLERELYQRGIYPPIAGLPSLSRLMKDGVGAGKTREDHLHLASQLFSAYSYVKHVRALASVIGEEELTPLDHSYLEFGEAFEKRFLKQGPDEERSIKQTLDLGWEVLSILPKEEMHRIREEELEKYYNE